VVRVLRDLVQSRHAPRGDAAHRALEDEGLIEPGASIARVFEVGYAELLRWYPSEYALLSESFAYLLGRDAPGSPVCAYRELAVAGCKADLALFFPDLAVGVEVKSRYDRLDRLAHQLATYQEVFDQVFVATDEEHAARVLAEAPKEVGVLIVTPDGIEQCRPAQSVTRLLSHRRLFGLLRKPEYLRLIRKHFGRPPRLPNTEIYDACLRLFQSLEITEAQALVYEAIRARTVPSAIERQLVNRLPHSIRALAVASNLEPAELVTLAEVLVMEPQHAFT
jgi:hypothetical protein